MFRSSSLNRMLVCCGASLASSYAIAAPPAKPPAAAKVSPDLAQAQAATVSVILQFINPPSAAELQQIAALGASSPQFFTSINGAQLTLPSAALSALSADANINYMSVDRVLSPHFAPPLPPNSSVATSAEYTAEPINAPAVWAKGMYGTGIGVAVIDSGITNQPDLGGNPGTPGPGNRVVYSQNFTTEGDANDHYGHGTHVAGLIGGNGAKSTGKQFTRTFVGIAPNVNLLNLRVLDSSGQGTDASVIHAIDTAIALKSKYNIRVINLSLGRGVFESYTLDPPCQAVEQAWKAGIVVVVAAGNDGRNLSLNGEGYGTIDAPGNDPYVLTVGATNTMNTATLADDVMASYSSKGPTFIDQVAKPDVVAPGNLVTSLHPGGSSLQTNNPTFYTPLGFYQTGPNTTGVSPDYMPLSGTSMATGVTSGAVALLLNANANLTPDQVKALLMLNANKSVLPATSSVTDNGFVYVDHNDVFTVGAGYLDIAAAVSQASNGLVPSGTVMSPIALVDQNTNNFSLVTDSTALWGRTSLFSASGVYGSNAFLDGTTALWGRSELSGADDPAGFTALWSSTALWGRDIPDASTALWGRNDVAGSTALWGRSAPVSTTALWGRDILLDH